MAANIQGIVINEILADPRKNQNNQQNNQPQGFDTDGDGTVEVSDEFVELFNSSNTAVDVSGWTIGDGDGDSFVFPNGTIIPAGGKVTVVGEYSGTLPGGFFEGLPSLENDGDEVILSNGTKTIAAIYNGGDDPNDIPTGAETDDFGNIEGGRSATRTPNNPDKIQNNANPTPECFLTGTLIQTIEGDCKVEDLKIGDVVQTVDGKPERIKWIGRQTLGHEGLHPFRAYPVQIKAGALGNGLPLRDLYVSPDHALLVDGVLANAGALINDVSIVQITPETETFNYYHIELERHALMLAEGTPAESFIPQNVEGRDKFENVEEFAVLYPEADATAYMPMSFPRVSSKRQLPRSIAKRLQEVGQRLYVQLAHMA